MSSMPQFRGSKRAEPKRGWQWDCRRTADTFARSLFAALRRRSRFSLAGLLVALTVICALFGARSWLALWAERDGPAAARLEQLGGYVNPWNAGSFLWQKRLVSFLGVRDCRVRSVNIDCAGLSPGEQEECVELLHSFRVLTGICVKNCASLRDEDLGRLPSCRTIDCLHLLNTSISDESAKYLKTYPNLGIIHIEGSPVSDKFLEEIVEFPCLYAVTFKNTKITDDGVLRLRKARPDVMISADVPSSDGILWFRGPYEHKANLPELIGP